MPDYALLEEKEEPSTDKAAEETATNAAATPTGSTATANDATETSAPTTVDLGATAAPSQVHGGVQSASASASARRGLSLDPPSPSVPTPTPHGSSFPFSPSSVVSLTPARRFASPPLPASAATGSTRNPTPARPPLSRVPSTPSSSGSAGNGSALKANPEEHTNPLSYICYWWLSPLVDLGATRPLSDSDLYEVRTDYAAAVTSSRFQREWAKEVRRATAAGDRSKASLLGPFNRIYGRVSAHNQHRSTHSLTSSSECSQHNTTTQLLTGSCCCLCDSVCVCCMQNYWLAFLSKVTGDSLSFVQPMLLQLLLASLATQTFTYCMMAAFAMVRQPAYQRCFTGHHARRTAAHTHACVPCCSLLSSWPARCPH